MPITSFNGPLLGFNKSRSRGKDAKPRRKKAKMRTKTKHWNLKTPHTKCVCVCVCVCDFFWVILYDKTGKIENVTFFGPLMEVMATNIHWNSPLKYTEEGDKTSPYSYLVVILSNSNNRVYRLPTHSSPLFAHQAPSPLLPLFPFSPPPLSPLLWLPETLILVCEVNVPPPRYRAQKAKLIKVTKKWAKSGSGGVGPKVIQKWLFQPFSVTFKSLSPH